MKKYVAEFIGTFVLTCIFLIAILGVTSKESFSSVAGLVIGLTLTFVHIIGIPLTGTSVNPARSLGPAIFTGGEALSQVWVFIVGPFVGAAIAAVIWMFLSAEDGSRQIVSGSQKSELQGVFIKGVSIR